MSLIVHPHLYAIGRRSVFVRMAYVYLRDAGGLLTDCVRIVEKLIFFLSLFQLIAYFCKQLKYN